MSKDSVSAWDTVANNNTDIAGVNISEFCPPSSINDAIRTVMAQIASFLTATGGFFLRSGGDITGSNSTISDGQTTPTQRLIGYRGFPFTAATTGRTLVLTDLGMCIPATGTMTVPLNSAVAFAVGDIVGIYNNSAASISITATSGVTLRLGASASTGTRTLAQRGFVSLMKVGTDEWVALTGGVS